MKRLYSKLGAVQNVGLLDRVVRLVVGAAMVGVVYMDFLNAVAFGWHAYLPILAIYPLMTGSLGWDPLYAAGHVKSCDTSSRNQCGTFPYEIESAVGKDVHCADGYDCSISGNDHINEHKREAMSH